MPTILLGILRNKHHFAFVGPIKMSKSIVSEILTCSVIKKSELKSDNQTTNVECLPLTKHCVMLIHRNIKLRP